ncbi:unnamed protein product [Prunus armeniaca]
MKKCPIISFSSPIQGEKGNELENTALEKDMTCRTKASNRLPISEDETCDLREETTGRPLKLNQLPISEDEASTLGVKTISRTEASNQLPVYENNDSDSCKDEFDAIPPTLSVPKSTRDSESSEVDGSIGHCNAKLVAKGYTQTYGVNYFETFALVAKLNTVHVLLSLATNRDWPLLQFDVKNVFLHSDLEEEIYMDLPPSIPITSKKDVVCKLRKSLYGLKKPLRVWFRRFAASMKKFGYVQSNSNHTLFLKRHKSKLTALIIYVDDIIVTGDDKAEMKNLQKYLAFEFDMNLLGDLKYFLGIEVARSKHGIFLSQRKYVLDLLAKTRMLDCKPIDTPSEQKLGLYPDQVPTDKECYQRLVGKLIYLAYTRPDIAYAVSVVSQLIHSPSEDHMGAVMRILRYLKVTLGNRLMFCKYGHTDVDWADSVTDKRSTSRYFTFIGGNLVS